MPAFSTTLLRCWVFREQYGLSSEQTENSVDLPRISHSLWDVFQNSLGTELSQSTSSQKDREALTGLWSPRSTIMEGQLFCSQKGEPFHRVYSVGGLLVDLPSVSELLPILKPKPAVQLQDAKEILAAQLLTKDQHYHHDSCPSKCKMWNASLVSN